MSVPKSALHCTQIFNVAKIEFFGKFGTGVYVGEGGEKKANREESTGVDTSLPSIFP